MRESCAALALTACLASGAALAEVSAERQVALEHLLRHDCGSCHGLRLTGGLGPPLTASALADRPAAALEHAILEGRPGTPMPPWRGMLSVEETRWLVERLLAGEEGVR